MKKALAICLSCLALLAPAEAAERVVNVFNWSDYIDPKVIEDFTRETGVKVVYDTYDSNEILEARLLAGASGYDVVVPSATFFARELKADVLRPLDFSKLPNAKSLWPEINAKLARYDKAERHGVDYMWYTTGIAFNVAKVKARLGGKTITSWGDVFRPESLKKLADCGVYMLDAPEDMFAITFKFMKLDPNSKNPEDFRRAALLLSGLRRYVKKFHSSEYINGLANGDICVALSWSGDAFQAKARAHEANNGVDIDFAIPQEGTLISMDVLAIPADAPHPDEAHLFINYMLRPDVAAKNTNATHFANGVLTSRPMVDLAILNNPSIYPSEATMAKLFAVTAPDIALQRTVTREWTRVKTGR